MNQGLDILGRNHHKAGFLAGAEETNQPSLSMYQENEIN
jgi:hypothetical protein